MWKKLLILLSSVILLSCAKVAPSPLISHWAINNNSDFSQMVLKCSDGPNFTPEAEGCDLTLLKEKGQEVLDLAVELIKADNIQSQGFDIYLHTSMIILRMSAGACRSMSLTPEVCDKQLKEYQLIENVALQFVKTEEAYSGNALDKARFWRVYYLNSNVGLRYRLGVFAPDTERVAYIIEVVRDASEKSIDVPGEYKLLYTSQVQDLILFLSQIPQ